MCEISYIRYFKNTYGNIQCEGFNQTAFAGFHRNLIEKLKKINPCVTYITVYLNASRHLCILWK